MNPMLLCEAALRYEARADVLGPQLTPGEVFFCVALWIAGIVALVFVVRHGMKRTD